eukprot:m.6821 g.6821  ORF g.6821 m.6821 type:complete len:309 (+) comp2656_c0_seq1:52-978(+)
MDHQFPLRCIGHTRPVMKIAFSNETRDGIFLASAGKDKTPMLRDGTTGDWIGSFIGHGGAVWSVDIDENAIVVATGSADFTAKVWDATTGKETRTVGHKHVVKSVAISEGCKLLATGCKDKIVRLFDLRAPDKEGIMVCKHGGSVDDVVFVDGNTCVVSGCDSNSLVSTNLDTMQSVVTDLDGSVKDIALNSNDQTLHVCSTTSFNVFSPSGDKLLSSISLPSPVYSSCVSPIQEDLLVWGGDDQALHICDMELKENAKYKSHFGAVHCVRFSPDGELFASCSEDGTIFLWQTHPGKTYGLWRAVDDV